MKTIFWSSVLGCLLASCGGGGGGASGGTASGDFLIRDAPADQLLSFTARVEQLRLVDAGGGSSANLLQAPVTLEMIGLQSRMSWLAHASFPAGTWSSVRISLAPGSIEARDMSGALVPVDVRNGVLTAPLSQSVSIGASGYRRWMVDLDLAGSLTGSISSPPLDFDAHGTAVCDGGGPGMDLDSVRGLVQSADAAGSSLVMTTWVDDRCMISMGSVTVSVPPEARLIDTDGTLLTGPAFFAALVPGSSFLEVAGLHSHAGIQAERIQILDQQGGTGTRNEVQIDGRVAALGPGTTFSLLIQHVEQGASIADPVLASLGDPPSIVVGYDESTLFVADHAPGGDAGMLAVGERVEVQFPVFDNPPFHAARVVIEDSAEFEGTIQSTAGLPGSMVIHLLPGSLAIAAGQVASDTTDVTVLMPGSSWRLGIGMGMAMQPSQLLAGMRVRIHGVLSGPPTAPTIDADHADCSVHPGRCRGTVTGTMMGSSMFDCSASEVLEPFGGGAYGGPYEVHLMPTCTYYGDASSESDFYSRCGGMHGGHHMDVDIQGIGTGAAGQVHAYVIEARAE